MRRQTKLFIASEGKANGSPRYRPEASWDCAHAAINEKRTEATKKLVRSPTTIIGNREKPLPDVHFDRTVVKLTPQRVLNILWKQASLPPSASYVGVSDRAEMLRLYAKALPVDLFR